MANGFQNLQSQASKLSGTQRQSSASSFLDNIKNLFSGGGIQRPQAGELPTVETAFGNAVKPVLPTTGLANQPQAQSATPTVGTEQVTVQQPQQTTVTQPQTQQAQVSQQPLQTIKTETTVPVAPQPTVSTLDRNILTAFQNNDYDYLRSLPQDEVAPYLSAIKDVNRELGIQLEQELGVDAESAVDNFMTTGEIPSTSLSGASTQAQMIDLLSRREQTRQELLSALQPTAEEQALQSELQQARQAVRSALLGQTERLEDIADEPISAEAIQARQEILTRDEALGVLALQNQVTNLEEQLSLKQEGRKLGVDVQKTVSDFDSQTFNTLFELQKLTRPDVIDTQVNKQTGDIYTLTQDPVSGVVRTTFSGNIGVEEASKDYISTGTYINSAGQKVFYGVTPDRKIEQTLIGQAGTVSSDKERAPSESERKTLFLQYLNSPLAEGMSKSDLESEAISTFGINPTDADVQKIFEAFDIKDPGALSSIWRFFTGE